MRAEIIGLSQEMNLLTGTFSNVLRLQLLDGTVVTVGVEEAVVAKVTELFVQTGGAASTRAQAEAGDVVAVQLPPQTFHAPLRMDDEGNDDFGGDYGGAPEAEGLEEYEVRQAPPAASPAAPKRALQVSADEQGNPVISGRNVRDAHDVLGADDEEDGVGSV